MLYLRCLFGTRVNSIIEEIAKRTAVTRVNAPFRGCCGARKFLVSRISFRGIRKLFNRTHRRSCRIEFLFDFLNFIASGNGAVKPLRMAHRRTGGRLALLMGLEMLVALNRLFDSLLLWFSNRLEICLIFSGKFVHLFDSSLVKRLMGHRGRGMVQGRIKLSLLSGNRLFLDISSRLRFRLMVEPWRR